MDDFKWGIPITDPDEIAAFDTRLREMRESRVLLDPDDIEYLDGPIETIEGV